MSKGKKIAVTASIVVMVIAVGVSVLINRIRSKVYDAYASEWVAGEIIEYMKSHNGAWPRSWADLRPIHNRHVSEGTCPWKFEMFQGRVVVDWHADPNHLVVMPKIPNKPPFHVVTLRNGKATYWRGMEPNALIHRWLIKNARTSSNNGHGARKPITAGDSGTGKLGDRRGNLRNSP